MGRYSKPTIRLDFPDLSEDSDLIFVEIRNPKTLPMDQLMPKDDPEQVEGQEASKEAMTTATFGIMAGLVKSWHVYDATLDDDSDPLPLPATAEHIRVLPFEIQQALMKQISEVIAPPQ